MGAAIQFFRGVDEPVVPDIRLTRSRDGRTGQALFVFEEPDADLVGTTSIRLPAPLAVALVSCVVVVIITGVLPQTVASLSEQTYPLSDAPVVAVVP